MNRTHRRLWPAVILVRRPDLVRLVRISRFRDTVYVDWRWPRWWL